MNELKALTFFLIFCTAILMTIVSVDNHQYSMAQTNDNTPVVTKKGSTPSSTAETTTTATSKESGDIAKQVYNARSLTLGKDVKNVVITIPNEAHESPDQPKNQLPLTDQPYLPQNLTVNTGTSVVWFNADVDHVHKLQADDKSSTLQFSSPPPTLAYNSPSSPMIFSKQGTLNYISLGVNKNGPTFTMKGALNVQDNPSTSTTIKGNPDTIGVYMIPYILLDKYIHEFNNEGLKVDSYYTYKDMRGGQKGTGPEQTLLVWDSSNIPLQKILTFLTNITPTLPYS